ncbi:MAG: hypothetical protein JO215_16240, partial [Ktedonobacteraceae bacterium]|nr:hypothetical protein [Ktedonobacteraceae bacterium]
LHSELFSIHALECDSSTIEIPDEAFERIFNFFDEFQWFLQHHPPSNEREINPAILGHVFEKHINQQQMGAYYTREDVTAYIAKNSILPALFEAAECACPRVFGKKGTLWRLVQHHPERYIQDAIRYEKHLPAETEREYRQRQAYYLQMQERIAEGQICCIDDFIHYNLDIDRFMQDILHNIDEPEVLDAFYQCLAQMTILDPTCGSGVFLCGALHVLKPIYEACLEQMEHLHKTIGPSIRGNGRRGVTLRAPACSSGHTPRPADAPTSVPNVSPARMQTQINPALAILKSIISTNLYGVDIMEEATELCRLRLFLMLLGAVERVEEMESLAKIDFHIQTGNALVGFPGRGQVRREQKSLDRELAREYGVEVENEEKLEAWRESHKPFHWALEFAEVMDKGGFDCIIGNPPYVEYTEKMFPYRLQHFSTLTCRNLYPCVIERSRAVLSEHGRLGMIVPLAAFATRNMIPLIEGVQQWFAASWISFYHFRPSMLFSGEKVASIPTAIMLARISGTRQRFSTPVSKWATENRSQLFPTLKYCQITAPRDLANRHYYAKFGQACENAILEKVLRQRCVRDYLERKSIENRMFYRSAGGLYWKVFLNFPWPYQTTSNKQCSFQKEYERDVFVALFNSSLFWWYYTTTFDTFNLKDYMLFGFRFTYPEDERVIDALREQCQRLMEDFRRNAKHLKRGETGSYTIYARKSKQILDD